MNVSLRDLQRDDERWLDAWLSASVRSVEYDRIDASALFESLGKLVAGGVIVRIIVATEPVGLAIFRIDDGRGMFEFVGLAPAASRQGLGQRGAMLAEEEMRTAGARRLFAPAPAMHGIAVYFWVRLGYRPLLRAEWPCARDGVAWLARDLDQPTNGMKSSIQSKASTP
jgi:GNAT superfamily N-acetyltransferase